MVVLIIDCLIRHSVIDRTHEVINHNLVNLIRSALTNYVKCCMHSGILNSEDLAQWEPGRYLMPHDIRNVHHSIN